MPDDIARITIYLTDEEKRMLDRLAKHDKRSISNLIAYWTTVRYREEFGDEPPPPANSTDGRRRRAHAASSSSDMTDTL